MPEDSIRITGNAAIDYAEHVGATVGYQAPDGDVRFVDVEAARILAKAPTIDRLFFNLPYHILEDLSLEAANEGDRALLFTSAKALQGDTIAAGVCACVLIERAK